MHCSYHSPHWTHFLQEGSIPQHATSAYRHTHHHVRFPTDRVPCLFVLSHPTTFLCRSATTTLPPALHHLDSFYCPACLWVLKISVPVPVDFSDFLPTAVPYNFLQDNFYTVILYSYLQLGWDVLGSLFYGRTSTYTTYSLGGQTRSFLPTLPVPPPTAVLLFLVLFLFVFVFVVSCTHFLHFCFVFGPCHFLLLHTFYFYLFI